MVKVLIVKNNKIAKIAVAKSIDAVKLGEGEKVYEYPNDNYYKVGDVYKTFFGRFLDFIGLR
jgi:hypothetical protein